MHRTFESWRGVGLPLAPRSLNVVCLHVVRPLEAQGRIPHGVGRRAATGPVLGTWPSGPCPRCARLAGESWMVAVWPHAKLHAGRGPHDTHKAELGYCSVPQIPWQPLTYWYVSDIDVPQLTYCRELEFATLNLLV